MIYATHTWSLGDETQHQIGRDDTGQLWWQQHRRCAGCGLYDGVHWHAGGWNMYSEHNGEIEAEELLRLAEQQRAVQPLEAWGVDVGLAQEARTWLDTLSRRAWIPAHAATEAGALADRLAAALRGAPQTEPPGGWEHACDAVCTTITLWRDDCPHCKRPRHAALRSSEQAGAEFLPSDAEALARAFHEAYERLAPSYGYATREESAKPWAEVPPANRILMLAVARELLRMYPGLARVADGAQPTPAAVPVLMRTIRHLRERAEEVRREMSVAIEGIPHAGACGATAIQVHGWLTRLADPAPENPVAGGICPECLGDEACADCAPVAHSSMRPPAPEPAATEAEEERSDEGDPRYWPAPERKGCCMPDRCLCPHPEHDSSECFDREMAEAQAAEAGELRCDLCEKPTNSGGYVCAECAARVQPATRNCPECQGDPGGLRLARTAVDMVNAVLTAALYDKQLWRRLFTLALAAGDNVRPYGCDPERVVEKADSLLAALDRAEKAGE